ncbi:MAG: 7-carboxy-7-deazaguanine synthase, partial [Paludibacteraceae bacterium]|nr:7-carboxy-7-deazaguanine synthase [Paludibacteraceae bacterium]
HDAGYYIAIETNGTHSLPDDIDWVTCSPKEGSHVVLSEADEVKIVYTGQDVEHWREQLLSEHYLLQPCSCQNTKQVVDYVLSHPWWRLSLQTHKILDIK